MYFDNAETPDPGTQNKRIKKVMTGEDGEEYIYNAKGQLSQILTIKSKKSNYRTEFSYNDAGQLVKVMDYNLEESQTGVVDEVISITYKDSKTIEVRDVFPGYEEENRTKILKLNDKGQVIGMTMIFEGPEDDSNTYTYEYDNSGNIIKVTEKDNVQTKTYTYAYDDKQSYAKSLGISWYWIMEAEKSDAILPIGPNNIVKLAHEGHSYITKYEYDSDGYPSKGTDPYGDAMEFVYEVVSGK